MNQTYTLTSDCTLFHADCRDAMRALPDNCVDSICTDPPYHLLSTVKRFANSPRTESTMPKAEAFGRHSVGFMGQTWDGGDIAFRPDLWAEVLRVLKPGGHVVAFGASRGYHRMACAIEDAGFEVRDSLMWLFGTGFPKSQDVSKFIDRELGEEGGRGGFKSDAHETSAAKGYRTQTGIAIHDRPWMDDPEALDRQARKYIPITPQAIEFDGWGTALKPAFEPIVLARKPLSEDTVAANVLRWRTGALNIRACRVETTDVIETSRNVVLGSSSGGIYGTANIPGVYTQNDAGRWPANVVHSGEAEVVEVFPTTKPSEAHIRHNASNGTIRDQGMYRGPAVTGGVIDDGGSAARYFKTCEWSEMDRRVFYSAKASKADRAGSKHPTVKPVALMSWLVNLITPPGGVVLDPFAGSGTTGAAALASGKAFKVIMCEREAQYVADIVRRITGHTESPSIAPA